MSKFIFTLKLMFISCLVFSQATLSEFNGTFDYKNFAPNGSNIRGTLSSFSDQSKKYTCNDLLVGDVCWDINGKKYKVVSVISKNATQAVVDLSRIGGGSHIPKGRGFVSRETQNLGLSLLPTTNSLGISPILESQVHIHNLKTIDLKSSQDTIYILASGQSNALGRPDTSVTHGLVQWDSTRNEKVLVFNTLTKKWEVAWHYNSHGTAGVYYSIPVNNATWQLCKQIQRKTGKVVKYVISARGGRALSYWTANTYPMTGEGWDSLRNSVTYSGIHKFDAFIWDQGESDINNANYEYYFKNQFIKTLRGQQWFDNWTPIIITGMPVVNPIYRPFNERLEILAENSDPYINIAHTDSLALTTNDPFSPGNNVHFTGLSLDQLGATYYNALVNTPKNYKKSGIYDLRNRDILINGNGNELRLDSIGGRIKVDPNQSFYIEKTEPGWVGRFEPYQYLSHTSNGDPRFEFQSFTGDNFDAPSNITQNLGYPRLGSFHFRGWLNGAYRRGASIAVYPDSVFSNFISGMMRFTTVAGGNGFNISETIMSMSQRGHAMGPGIIKPDNDAAWQVDQSNKDGYLFNGTSRIYSKFKNTILAVQDNSEYSFIHNPATNKTRIVGVIYRDTAESFGWFTGAGSPEGTVTASKGSLYTRTDGGAGTTLYIKESGTGNTGWVAK